MKYCKFCMCDYDGIALEWLEMGSNEVQRIFEGVDKNNNGQIDIRELYNGLKRANQDSFNPETCQLLMSKYGHI